ncbi:MAG: hypothetical protein AB4352_15605 [Hormoscilla sp.]
MSCPYTGPRRSPGAGRAMPLCRHHTRNRVSAEDFPIPSEIVQETRFLYFLAIARHILQAIARHLLFPIIKFQ